MVVEENPHLRPGCTAAFQAPLRPTATHAGGAQEDVLVAVAEVRDPSATPAQLQEIVDSVRAAVMRQAGIGLSALLLLKPHTARKVRLLQDTAQSACTETYC